MAGAVEDTNQKKIEHILQSTEVFETEDLPEDDQNLQKDLCPTIQEVEGLEQGRLDVKEAFKLFEDKNIDSTRTDFSDSIATYKSGYLTSQKQPLESREQKHAKLCKQLQELKEEVALLKGRDDENEADLMAKVEYMTKQLNLKGGGSSVLEAVKLQNDKENVEGRRLMNHLDTFLTTSASSTTPNPPPSNTIRYDILCDGKSSLDSLLLESLEQRVSRCEKVVGKLQTQNHTSSENPNKTILGALSLVVARFSLLDLSQLAHFESTLLAIHQKLIQASSKSDASDIADKVDKLSRTYEVVKKADGAFDRVVSLGGEIKGAASAHLTATQFSRTLKQIGHSQKDLSDGLQSQSDNLKQIQALMAPQMQLFEDNCQHIEALIK